MQSVPGLIIAARPNYVLASAVPTAMTITLQHWCRRARVAAMVAVCAALSLPHRGGLAPLKAAAPQAAAAPSNGLEVLEVRPSFFVIAGAGANIGVQVGDDGVVVVDAGSAADAPAVLAAIKRISPKPIRYVIDTGPDADHVGGNEVLSKAGEKLFGGSNLGGGAAERRRLGGSDPLGRGRAAAHGEVSGGRLADRGVSLFAQSTCT